MSAKQPKQSKSATQSTIGTEMEVRQQQLVEEIGQLWPRARERAKELGEKLFNLRETCQGEGESFDAFLKTLGIPHSSAYHFIGIYEECILVDFEFPANVVKVAATANIDITDLNNRRVLLASYRSQKSPASPTDGEAIAIVGSAVAAIKEAAKVRPAKRKLVGFEKCCAAQDTAFVSMYLTITKSAKKDSPQRAAAEGKYVSFANNFFPKTWFQPLADTKGIVLRIGRRETTLFKEVVASSNWYSPFLGSDKPPDWDVIPSREI